MTPAKTPPGSPKPNLHILMVEDVPEDFELVMNELGNSGLTISSKRIETEDALVAELARQPPPDLVISDHACGVFDSFQALARVRSCFLDVPFILVTGALRGELMVKALDRGVDDWVSKDRLSDLLPAVLRALRLAEERRLRRHAEIERDWLLGEVTALRSQPQLKHLVRICASCKKIRDEKNEWVAMETYLESRHGIRLSQELCGQCARG